MIELVDTHCHIHFPDYKLDADEVRQQAVADGVSTLICVGCTLDDSEAAIDYADKHDGVWASIGLHPHEAKQYVDDEKALQRFRELATKPKVIAIGETGLDYYYNHSSKEAQQKLFRWQLEVALAHDLPLIFHVRDAFDDFWPIIDEHKGIKGVVHSFTDSVEALNEILKRGLYVGLNGIMTFTKDPGHKEMMRHVPLERLVLETDAPFLTPVPFRGRICEPKHVRVTAEFLCNVRGESLVQLAAVTTHNARELFGI